MADRPLRIVTLTGQEARAHVPALSRLRAAVFRDWPYLYVADAESEAEYLETFLESPNATIVLALEGEEPVGAATCQPMAESYEEVIGAAEAVGMDPAATCYFGESVLLPEWRGRGTGVAFFAAREARARALGLARTTFCAVRRAPDDPRRPPAHVPLDAFWRKRGYEPVPGMACRMDWPEPGGAGEVAHQLDFWARSLT